MTKSKEDPSVLGQFIPLHYHFNMLRDKARMDGFQEALKHVVTKDTVVLELGGGSGVLSFFAAQSAKKVYCVEKNPEMVEAAKRFLAINPNTEKIQVVEADAMTYVPPEPVDVVVCEMIHVGMLRERQVQVINAFKKNYIAKFGKKLPLFVPEAGILAIQPIQQSFDFNGYLVPTPLFYDATGLQNETSSLADPFNYQMLVYSQELSEKYVCDTRITIHSDGLFNAIRFITKNVLAILVKENRTVDWFSQYLIMPIKQPIAVKKGDVLRLRFAYGPGDSLETLCNAIQLEKA